MNDDYPGTPAQAMLAPNGMWAVFDRAGRQLPNFQGPDNPEVRRALALRYQGPVETARGMVPYPDWAPACDLCGERPALHFYAPGSGVQKRVCMRHSERGIADCPMCGSTHVRLITPLIAGPVGWARRCRVCDHRWEITADEEAR